MEWIDELENRTYREEKMQAQKRGEKIRELIVKNGGNKPRGPQER